MSERPVPRTDRPAPSPGEAVLDDVLRWVHIGGALFLRAELTAPWGYRSPPAERLAAVLAAGPRRVILFHVIAEGSCTLRIPGGAAVDLAAGDCVILPYGHQHEVTAGGASTLIDLAGLLPPPPWSTLQVVRYGGGGACTQIVCGYLLSDDLLFNPMLGALPPLLHVRPGDSPLAGWVEASFRYALHAGDDRRPVDDVLLQRLPELLFAECLRRHVRADRGSGWFAALADPLLARALHLMHADCARPWTVVTLARAAATSRSRLDEHFRRQLGIAPMSYLAQWRLQVAARLLRDSGRSLDDIADAVGYASAASLSRAFKRRTGATPLAWRAG